MRWKVPPTIKVYEALGAIVDNRIKIAKNTAIVTSSSGGKTYQVNYQPDQQAITSNDNSSYWQGYLGYPAIAFLMKSGILKYNSEIGNLFKGVKWKDINTKFKDDYEKTETHLKKKIGEENWTVAQELARKVLAQIKQLKLNRIASKEKPPEGY